MCILQTMSITEINGTFYVHYKCACICIKIQRSNMPELHMQICRYVVIQLQLQHCTSHKLLYNICMHVNCSNMGDFRFLKQTKNNRERDWTPLPPTTYFLFGNRLILTQRKVTFLTNWPLDFFKERVQNYRENSRKDPISATKVNKTSFNFLTCWGRFALFPLSEKMLLALYMQKTTYVLPILI